MILDQQLMFSDAQALTASANTQNDIDLGPLTGGIGVNPYRDIGAGEPLWIFAAVTGTVDMAPAGASAVVNLSTDDNTAFGTPVALGQALAIPAGAKAGQVFFARLNPANYERYLRAAFAVTGGPYTAGAISVGIIWNEQMWRAYASGFTTGI